ncbi:type III-A CRISPR-associated protein Cas10/Csm1 [Accumulibacter sp.]|uniref:type III-A CRISPR-associated protein Cas10/Csm1 n=1 Tax=Accumulibacter sp. TaxID=2053492 RepID=UPI0025F00717|nr:type III-A CRISPR-associated protein Cas10/Csm1 [Accumulibacter sp.]MCM8626802.1 type III-A CRISPR-associated protein Cas10/Csm1 [Accumulibacter sp.]
MNHHNDLLDRGCRVAFAALLHDLGKFAERAGIQEIDRERLDAHVTNYCPFRDHKYHTHRHAAWTALMFEAVEGSAPDLTTGDVSPFASRTGGVEITDSLVNAAAMHHRPQTFLQWIIATADRVASGFERQEFETYNAGQDRTDTGRNHYQARQLTLFEQIRLAHPPAKGFKVGDLQWRYPLRALSPEWLFPVARKGYEPETDAPAQAEYQQLWQGFLHALEAIPRGHRSQWPLWLDHFDTAWQTFTHAIPAATAFGVKPDVSLYDHSKATAALATALWRWHDECGRSDAAAVQALASREDWDAQKLLLIQGDFFGIQQFIFADGAQTNRNAARLLRGRSFQVSLFTELAALKVLEACALPSTSQITNAAGKFLIVAPNTDEVRAGVQATGRELNGWFLEHSFGLAGLGLVARPASCNDLLKGRFRTLVDGLFADLEAAKLHRFDLVGDAPRVFPVGYPNGPCPYNDHLPADEKGSARLSRDQIALGTQIARQARLLVVDTESSGLHSGGVVPLETAIFGYRVAFTGDEEISGRFAALAGSGGLRRCWDFSLPERLDETLWNGYARRAVNAYVPRFDEVDDWTLDKYRGETGADDDTGVERGAGKTLNHIACEDRQLRADQRGWVGQCALMTLKGDVDDLGQIFREGLAAPTFARMAALSRQMNAFFAVWLPAYCARHHPETYTVFAGGDDFFLIGPWLSTQRLAAAMAEKFRGYVAENPEIHFSAGMVMSKPGLPIHTLASQAEEALDSAKSNGKNGITVFGERIPWADWPAVSAAEKELEQLAADYGLSAGYLYGLLQLIRLAGDRKNPESSIWRSRFAYRTRRYVVDKLRPTERQSAQARLAGAIGERGIARLGGAYRVPLFNHFYKQR